MPDRSDSLFPSRASARQLSTWRKLTTKKGRRESGQILLEGARLVAESIASDFTVAAIVFTDDDRGREAWRRLAQTATKKSISAFAVPPREFEKLTDTVHAAGIACVMDWKSPVFESGGAASGLRRVLVCDRIADPGNLGTLIRTAAGLGLDAVFLLPDTAELTNPKTVRAAAGALFHVPVFEDVPPDMLKSWAKRAEITLIVADAHRGESNPLTVSKRWALVVGGETIPLSKVWESAGTQWITLPLHRGVESLNAAVAGAIIMDRLCRSDESSSRAKR